jgi:hypothetical protein
MASEEQLIADRRNTQLSRAARTGEGTNVTGMNTLRHGFTDRIEITTSNENESEEAKDVGSHAQLIEAEGAPRPIGFVVRNYEIIPALHYVACPAIIERPGFQWRGPVSRPGSRPKKRKGRCLAPPYNEETFPSGGVNATRLARVPQKKKQPARPHYN